MAPWLNKALSPAAMDSSHRAALAFARGAAAMSIAEKRFRACAKLVADAHAIAGREGPTPSALHAIKLKLMGLARKTELFPAPDFETPRAEGRSHPLLVEDGDGYGLYLTINKPGKEAAPHDHGVWCVNAAISGRERHEFYRRLDDGGAPGRATVVKVGEVILEPGNGMAMADRDIHSQRVVGDEPAVVLYLYGYAVARFPPVAWYHPQFGTMRVSPSRRPAPAA